MSAPFSRIAVLGLGLLGGSVALAARRRGVADRVAGATRRRDVLDAALASGAVDEVGSFEEVVRDAELVVLSTPLFAMGEVVARIAPHLREGTLLTDVGSVKAPLVEMLPGLLPRGVVYVGAHPMAGSHLRGFEAAREDLFEGAPCVVTASDAPGAERVCDFWRALGCRLVLRDPTAHDSEVAWMSHLPHVLAFAFAAALEAAPEGAGDVAGSGFRDFTRIAHSDPELWAEILAANRKAVVPPLQEVATVLARLARAIEANDVEAVERDIAAGRSALAGVSEDTPSSGRESSAGENTNPRASRSADGAGDRNPTI